VVALALSSCGGGSSDRAVTTDEVFWHKGEPVVIAHHGPPPKKLVVKDIRVGTGAVLKEGATATFKFKNFDYRTGKRYEDWWNGPPFRTGFGKGESLGAWETGLKGMRVGGRRELIVPAKEAYGHVPEMYVLELIEVRQP
jgi:peptidylprolyl isomerase